jgi:hypothetical protein
VPRRFSIFFPQRDPLPHLKPPRRGGPPAGGAAAQTWWRSPFASGAAFDVATRMPTSTSTLRHPTWTWAQLASAVRPSPLGTRPLAAPRPHVHLRRAAVRGQHSAHRTCAATPLSHKYLRVPEWSADKLPGSRFASSYSAIFTACPILAMSRRRFSNPPVEVVAGGGGSTKARRPSFISTPRSPAFMSRRPRVGLLPG